MTVYESTFEKAKYLNKENTFEKVDKLMDVNTWKGQNELYQSEKIKLKCVYRKASNELSDINDYYHIIESGVMKFKKNRVYAFCFELGPNTEYNYLYFNFKDSGSYSKLNNELCITYKTSKDSYCFLNGFNYKIDG